MPTMINDLRIGIIGGSGLGEVLLTHMEPAGCEEHDLNTPFGKPSAEIVAGTFAGVPIALLKRHGQGHVLNPAAVPFRANIFALKTLGCTHIIASGACGSLREDIHPGDVVICDQLIDRTANRARTFYERAAVHVEFAEPFCPVMRRWLIEAAIKASRHQGIEASRDQSDRAPGHLMPGCLDASMPFGTVHSNGCYVCMEGPAFSTRAESIMHRAWGADVVGMTALPEARLAREAEMAYALVALPTDYDCWRSAGGTPQSDQQTLLEEIIGNLQRATAASIALIKAALANIEALRQQRSPAHDALRLAIWSDKSAIDREEVKRLAPLWGRYF